MTLLLDPSCITNRNTDTGRVESVTMASRLLTRVAPSLIKRVGVRSNAHLAVMPEDSRDWGLVKTDKVGIALIP